VIGRAALNLLILIFIKYKRLFTFYSNSLARNFEQNPTRWWDLTQLKANQAAKFGKDFMKKIEARTKRKLRPKRIMIETH